MRYRVTDYCKTMHQFILSLIYCLLACLISPHSFAESLSINVYLKLESNNQIASLIGDFNQFLEQHQLLSTYKINPFLTHYPLHNTLYLTNYEKKQIPAIINAVKAIANGQQSFMVSSGQFIASPSASLSRSGAKKLRVRLLNAFNCADCLALSIKYALGLAIN